MKNIYFKGLEKKLSEGYYIIACYGNNNQIRAYTLSKDNVTMENQSVNENIITCLNEMSLRVLDERPRGKGPINGKKTLIDLIISEPVYTLHFYKLANDKVLTSICKSSNGEYIPVKSVITEDIKSGMETMNGALRKLYVTEEKENFLYNFYGETYKHFRSVVEYQKTLKK